MKELIETKVMHISLAVSSLVSFLVMVFLPIKSSSFFMTLIIFAIMFSIFYLAIYAWITVSIVNKRERN